MVDFRSQQYGKEFGKFVKFIIESMPLHIQDEYRQRVISGIKAFDPTERKKYLDEVDVNLEVPEHLVALVNEGLNLMYQRTTAIRARDSLVEVLEKRD